MALVDPAFSIPFEHLHRYSYASELLRGKRVLDLASREGYGACILAETAESVIGLDVDAAVVQQAAGKHKRHNLRFLVGSAASIPITQEHAFDAIVCFDAMDDATSSERLLSEVKRLLRDDGLLLVSAPNEACGENLFRTRTFNADGFLGLLKPHFAHVQLLTQTIYANSTIQPASPGANGTGSGKGEPHYLLALVSQSPLPALTRSTYADSVAALLRNKERAIRALLDMKAYEDETIKRQERQLAERKQTLSSLEEAFAWHTSQIDSLEKTRGYLESEIDQLREGISSDRQALEWRNSQVGWLEDVMASKDQALEWRAGQVESLERQLQQQLDERQRQLDEHQRQLQEQTESFTNYIHKIEREMSLRIANLTEQIEAIHVTRGWKLVLFMRSIHARIMQLTGRTGR
jgi:O-antigen biosynthesis protein